MDEIVRHTAIISSQASQCRRQRSDEVDEKIVPWKGEDRTVKTVSTEGPIVPHIFFLTAVSECLGKVWLPRGGTVTGILTYSYFKSWSTGTTTQAYIFCFSGTKQRGIQERGIKSVGEKLELHG